MDLTTKLFFGKILGEIYRLQKNTEEMDCTATQGQIYGLLNGFEESIDEQIAMIGHITKEDVAKVSDILEKTWLDEAKVLYFKGYEDIEAELKEAGISKHKAYRILKYLHANKEYVDLIEMMVSDEENEDETNKFLLDDFNL
jgi:hypothetical protein